MTNTIQMDKTYRQWFYRYSSER